jgi:hypothetical protein
LPASIAWIVRAVMSFMRANPLIRPGITRGIGSARAVCWARKPSASSTFARTMSSHSRPLSIICERDDSIAAASPTKINGQRASSMPAASANTYRYLGSPC